MCTDRTTTTTLCGYELTQDLDFALAADYASGSTNYTDNTWRPTNASGTVLTGSAIGNATNAGFPGFGAETGDSDNGFTAIFEGNGHTISNLYSRASDVRERNVGLFRLLETNGVVRNVGVGANVYGGSETTDHVGGLVGYNAGTIIASHATGTVKGEAGTRDYVGGLVGYNTGAITAGYATAAASGGIGGSDRVGGLVGYNTGAITASYATGIALGGSGIGDRVGGLVGTDWNGTIRASYATGNSDGGSDGSDYVGGLVGQNGFSSTITASYATGNSVGGNRVGKLVGSDSNSAGIRESYAFGSATGNTTFGHAGAHPGGITAATAITADNAGASWDSTTDNTSGAWKFTSGQAPALRYADYDGTASSATTYSCSNYSATIPGTTLRLTCGSSLLGGSANQR